jgi:hypothetical protein
MKIFFHGAALWLLVLLTGCATRSISDSGYRHPHRAQSNSFYKGELSEFDVLGIERGGEATDAQITSTLDGATRVKVRKGSALLLIQSGASQPDDPMQTELAQYFNVVPFSGQPDGGKGASYARALRLAAAQAGCETVICYWGTLESARGDLKTKSLSWVPIVGWVLPDEKQQMRIRLKMALVDVRSGHWTMFSPEAFGNKAVSGIFDRVASDQGQVHQLKQLAYVAAINDLLKAYAH